MEREDGRIGNFLVDGSPSDILHNHATFAGLPPSSVRSFVGPAGSVSEGISSAVGNTLLVIPCSGTKATGDSPTLGPSVLELLSPGLRSRLQKARQDLAAKSTVDESSLLPAWRRYAGTLYQEAGRAFPGAVEHGVPVVIISGGYGLVLAGESIGWYNRHFSIRDWPPQLLEECLVEVAQGLRAQNVMAFCALTTAYADLIRRASWREHGIDGWLASPNMAGRQGAQRLVPQACGQALTAFIEGQLYDGWVSRSGVSVSISRATR